MAARAGGPPRPAARKLHPHGRRRASQVARETRPLEHVRDERRRTTELMIAPPPVFEAPIPPSAAPAELLLAFAALAPNGRLPVTRAECRSPTTKSAWYIGAKGGQALRHPAGTTTNRLDPKYRRQAVAYAGHRGTRHHRGRHRQAPASPGAGRRHRDAVRRRRRQARLLLEGRGAGSAERASGRTGARPPRWSRSIPTFRANRKGGLDNPLGAPRALPLQGRPRHPLPHPRHQRALEHRRGDVLGLRAHAQRGCRRPVRAGPPWARGCW